MVRLFELLPRVELGTSSLPRMRSTTELKQQHFVFASAKVLHFFEMANFYALFYRFFLTNGDNRVYLCKKLRFYSRFHYYLIEKP